MTRAADICISLRGSMGVTKNEERKAEPLVPDVGYVLVQRLVVRPDEKVMA